MLAIIMWILFAFLKFFAFHPLAAGNVPRSALPQPLENKQN